jgi:DNA end-binding protein Ku
MASPTAGESYRPVWKGFLRFSLVSIPVYAVTAKLPAQRVELHWLHKDCNHRIQYKKVCPVHGEVRQDEIVSGYQTGKRQYVMIEDEDLKKLRSHKTDTIHVDAFIDGGQLETLYCTENNYYLLPDGEASHKPYVTFQRSMLEADRLGIAQMALFRKEQLVAVRPLQDLLVLSVLQYAEQVRRPETLDKQVPDVKPSAQEFDLARHLIDASTQKDFAWAAYHDPYAEKVHELVAAKRSGRAYEGDEEEPPPIALDFAEALKRSLAQARKIKRPRLAGKTTSRVRHRKVS